ncbi:MAG: thermonuclease family protein [Deltaproteobacteria bacterium]|nr:thermonuclease family protein [Deltaproteobacteria bacterium]
MAIIVSVVAMGGLFHRNLHGDRVAPGLPLHAVVHEVIDGDTVIIEGGQKVRYLGINAPEVRVWDGAQWCVKPQIQGPEATAYNQRLVGGKELRLEYDQNPKDKFDRLLAYVWVGDCFVNGDLVLKGLALMDVRAPNLVYQKRLAALQAEARNSGRGIWRAMPGNTVSAEDAHGFVGMLAAVEGRILRTHLGEKKLHLNFGENVENDFTVIIYKENLSSFPLGRKDPAAYFLNKRVKVYGFIRELDGPAVVVCAPSQIDFLD